MNNVSFEDLSQVQQYALIDASKVLEHSYNPYSHFHVGATLVSHAGELISGTNFENAAYGSCICAERSAVLRANAMGIRKISGVAIIARGATFDTEEPTAPCGSCRQVLYEVSQISGSDLWVVLSSTKREKIILTTMSELLPLAFGPLDLGIDITRFQK